MRSYFQLLWLDSIAQMRCHYSQFDMSRMDYDLIRSIPHFRRKRQRKAKHTFDWYTLLSVNIHYLQHIRAYMPVDFQRSQANKSTLQLHYCRGIYYSAHMDWDYRLLQFQLELIENIYLVRNTRNIETRLRSFMGLGLRSFWIIVQ